MTIQMPKESENIKISSIIARKSAQNDNSKWLKLDLHATENSATILLNS